MLTLVVAILVLAVTVGGKLWRWQHYMSKKSEGFHLLKTQGFLFAAYPFKTALKENERDVDILRELSRGYQDLKRWSVADQYLSMWIAADPDAAEPRRRRFEARRQMSWVDAAIIDGEAVLKMTPEDADVQRDLIPLLIQVRRYADAERSCRRLLETNPTDAALRYELAQCCHARGEDKEAHALLDAVLKDDPNRPDAWTLRGILYWDAGALDKAVAALRPALELDPDGPVPRYYLGLALARSGEAAEADKEMAKLLEWYDGDRLIENAWVERAVALKIEAAKLLMHRGRASDSYQMTFDAMTLDPGNTEAMAEIFTVPKPKRRPVLRKP